MNANDTNAPSSQQATPQHYTQDFLADSDLLRDAKVISLENSNFHAMYVGIFSKKQFNNLDEFDIFTTNISSLTQSWYRHKNIQKAYEWYVPPADAISSFIPNMVRGALPVKEFIKMMELKLDFAQLPDFEGSYFYHYNVNMANGGYNIEEIGLKGEHDDYFFEIYVADNIEY